MSDQSHEFTHIQGKGKATRSGTQSNPFLDPVNEVHGEIPNEQASESKGQNVSKGSISSLWTYVKEFPVWRVFQDDDHLVVFRDDLGQCFVTFPSKGVNFPMSHRLTLERLDENLYKY